MMGPPAKENLPPKKRKENRPPVEVRDNPDHEDWRGVSGSDWFQDLLTITLTLSSHPPTVQPSEREKSSASSDGDNMEREATPSPAQSPSTLIANPAGGAGYYAR